MKIAVTRALSPSMNECQLTHVSRNPISIDKAIAQHKEYEAALQSLGCTVIRTADAPDLPDGLFVEDCAIVLPELAIITRPGAESRQYETASVAKTLKEYRSVKTIEAPGVLDGGDVLRIERDIYAGISLRSNLAAIEQLKSILEPYGYKIHAVEVNGCLHLKSAVTQVAEDIVLLNPDFIDKAHFQQFRIIETHEDEPHAANALMADDSVMYSVDFPQTALRLVEAGIELLLVDNSEVIKAEGGVTCCSLIFDTGD